MITRESRFIDIDPLMDELLDAVRAKGFNIEDEYSARQHRRNFVIIKQYPSDPPRVFLFGLIKRPAAPRILAHVFIKLDAQQKATSKHWYVRAYGRENLDVIRTLLEELAEMFRAKYMLELKSEELRFVYLGSD